MSIEKWRETYGKDKPINHVGTFESMTKQGNVTIQDQFKTGTGQLKSRTHSGLDGWYEVNGTMPYDEKPSDSAVMPHPVDPKVKPDSTKQPNPAPVSESSAPSQDSSARRTREQQQPQTLDENRPAERRRN